MGDRQHKPPADATGPWGSANGRTPPAHPPLTPEVVDVFNAVRDLPDHERPAALDRRTRGDAPLRAMVQRLLDAERSPLGERLAESLDDALVDIDDALSLPPSSQGGALPEIDDRYTIVRLLGSGSTGDVYLADQIQPVQRRVAIKVLRPAEVRASTVERMRREAVALSALDHPGIATIYDAGVTRDGRPYLATEWVEGPPIDRWCAEHGATFATRCELLASVCRAVEHAHQRGVIHRDLKPGNILVRMGDGGPMPKLVDLGIARLLEPHHGPGLSLTKGGHLLGTIGYIAPEQLEGGAADVRSDLFALGRVLEGLPGGVEGQTPIQRRDAAAIVRKATRTDPRERYQSAGDMADDLEALLEGRPVHARRQSLLEAGLRVSRRHKAATLLAAVALISVMGAIGTVGHKSAQMAEANRAQKALLKETLGGLTVVLSRYGGTVDQREQLVERMAGQLERMLAFAPDDPELRVLHARMLTEQARINIARRDFDQARPLADRAVELMESCVDERIASEEDLGHKALALIIRGDVAVESGRYQEARPYYERVLDMQRRAIERFPESLVLKRELCWSYDRLTYPLWLEHDPAYRDLLLERAASRMRLSQNLLEEAPDDPAAQHTHAMGCFRLGHLYVYDRDYAQAAPWFDRAREGLSPLVAGEPQRVSFVIDLAQAWAQLSLCHERMDDVASAVAAAEAAFATMERHVLGLAARHARVEHVADGYANRLDLLYARLGMDDQRAELSARLEAMEAYLQSLPG
ncbi:MAG: protein kinase [Phycisphaerales bacterium JB060]